MELVERLQTQEPVTSEMIEVARKKNQRFEQKPSPSDEKEEYRGMNPRRLSQILAEVKMQGDSPTSAKSTPGGRRKGRSRNLSVEIDGGMGIGMPLSPRSADSRPSSRKQRPFTPVRSNSRKLVTPTTATRTPTRATGSITPTAGAARRGHRKVLTESSNIPFSRKSPPTRGHNRVLSASVRSAPKKDTKKVEIPRKTSLPPIRTTALKKTHTRVKSTLASDKLRSPQ